MNDDGEYYAEIIIVVVGMLTYIAVGYAAVHFAIKFW